MIVIDKRTYRCGGVAAASAATCVNRAEALFARRDRRYVFCLACGFVREPSAPDAAKGSECPLCH